MSTPNLQTEFWSNLIEDNQIKRNITHRKKDFIYQSIPEKSLIDYESQGWEDNATIFL